MNHELPTLSPVAAAFTGEPLSARFAGMPAVTAETAGGALPARLMWMPGGVHEIACKQGTRSVRTFVEVTPATARVAQQALEAHNAESLHRPHFDLAHKHEEASAWPLRFSWSDTPQPGVYADLEWSQAGLAAVAGRSYRTFSPQFYTDCFPFTKTVSSRTRPARVTDAPLNMGGLVNDPAFREMPPLFAASARGQLTATTISTRTSTMNGNQTTELDPVAQSSRVPGPESETETAALAATATAVPPTTESELADARHQLAALQAENSARVRREAVAAVKAAVTRGALAAGNTGLHGHWQRLLEADPRNADLLHALPGSAALGAGRLVRPQVSIEREDTNDVLRGYLAASRDPKRRGEIYRKELDPILEKGGRIAFERLPLAGANSLGQLVGDIVSQRTLATLVSRRPLLRDIVTDFSDEQARLGQTIYTRAIGLPAVQNFGSAATDSAATDYPVQLSAHKQALFSFTAAECNSTGRNLVAEHSLALATALGNHLTDTVAALITDAFTSETTGAATGKTFADLNTANKALNLAGAPDFARNAWVNADFAEALGNDEVMVDHFESDSGNAYSRWKNVKGFENVSEYPALPGNSVNLIGFGFQKNALLLATRVAINPAELIGAGYPGTLQVITDPVTGLSVVANQWIDASTLAVNARLILLYGCARGLVGAGHKFVTS